MKIQPGNYKITLDSSGCYNLEPLVEKSEVKQWEDLINIDGFLVDRYSTIMLASGFDTMPTVKNTFKTKPQAKASIAIAQLTQLLADFNGDWVADWSSNEYKTAIVNTEEDIRVVGYMSTSSLLTFPSRERAKLFLKHHEALIKEAAPILFGVEL